jgi:hypothetical protein
MKSISHLAREKGRVQGQSPQAVGRGRREQALRRAPEDAGRDVDVARLVERRLGAVAVDGALGADELVRVLPGRFRPQYFWTRKGVT